MGNKNITDWGEYEDQKGLLREASERDPQCYPYGLRAGESVSCDWMWYWFSSPADRRAFLMRCNELEDGEDSAPKGRAGVSATRS